MLTLNDGRSELWQWDTGRTLAVDAECSQVHFSNKVFGRSIDVNVADGVAIIPDILLQTDKELNVWAFVGTAENGYTKISKTFKVIRRNKPADYVFTPQEQITLKDATAILEEAKDVANYAMETAKKAEASADKAAKIADEMKKLADQVEKNTEKATKAKADALTAKANAEEARNAAETAKKAAEEAANSAGTDASAASAAATRAENAANNAMNALSDTQALYQTMQEYVSQSVHDIQTEGNTQVQRVADEGTAQTAAAKEQADRAQAEADRAEAAREKAEEVVESCIPDDTAVDGKPWTSKKIVDSLCMPFEESGNPVQVYPVENYPLGVKVSWKPVQEGSGDPSLDNIRPITGRDTVRLTRCGKNLIDTSRIELGTFDQSTGEPVAGIANQSRITYDIGCAAENQMVYSNFKKENARAFFWNDNGYVGTLLLTNGSAFTPITGSKYMRLVSASSGFIDSQLELGSTATPYEPYTGSTTDIALPETVYGGEVDAVSGESRRTWRTITLTGEEYSHIYTDLFYLDLYKDSSFVQEKAASLTDGKSSHYKYGLYSKDCIGITMNGDSVVYSSNGKYPISNEGIQEWKDYLAAQYAAGTPVQVCYKLAEPVPFSATGAQPIPALSGVNTIYTDAEGVIVTGAEDPKHTITELKNAIISLGGNV